MRLLALALVLLMAGCASRGELVGKPVPSFRLTTSDGAQVNESTFAGRWLVLDLMATWCAPCKEQARELRAALAERADLAILSVDVDPTERPAELEAFAEANGFSWPHGVDPGGEVGRAMRVANIPKLVLVDPSGKVVFEQDVAKDGVVRASEITSRMR